HRVRLSAVLPQATSADDPSRTPKPPQARQRYVLDRMRAEGFITPAQYESARQEPLEFAPRRPGTYLAAPWYVEHVRRLLEDRYGAAAAQLGLRVYTACDLNMQRAAEESLN